MERSSSPQARRHHGEIIEQCATHHEGRLSIHIAGTFPPAQAAQAYRRPGKGSITGEPVPTIP
jgi:hypothetical protein